MKEEREEKIRLKSGKRRRLGQVAGVWGGALLVSVVHKKEF